MVYQFRVGSVTNAQRANRALAGHGYRGNVIRMASPSKEDGCGYAVRVSCESPEPVSAILRSAGVYVIGVDRE